MRPSAGEANLISGNGFGLDLYAGSPAIQVEGNYIGTDVLGMATLANGTGAVISDGSVGQPGIGNLISGNVTGIAFDGQSGLSSSQVQGNLIGTDWTGTNALGNQIGVASQFGGGDNTIGGTTSGPAM